MGRKYKIRYDRIMVVLFVLAVFIILLTLLFKNSKAEKTEYVSFEVQSESSIACTSFTTEFKKNYPKLSRQGRKHLRRSILQTKIIPRWKKSFPLRKDILTP